MSKTLKEVAEAVGNPYRPLQDWVAWDRIAGITGQLVTVMLEQTRLQERYKCNLSLCQLRYFVAVVKGLPFAGAAQRLQFSQQAFSLPIERTARRVVLMSAK